MIKKLQRMTPIVILPRIVPNPPPQIFNNAQRFKVNVQRFKVNLKWFKVTHAACGQNLSASVHFHHVARISINYPRGENSMNVEILNQNNSEH
jgi:hypothetical protein